jgi:hypothetical protein
MIRSRFRFAHRIRRCSLNYLNFYCLPQRKVQIGTAWLAESEIGLWQRAPEIAEQSYGPSTGVNTELNDPDRAADALYEPSMSLVAAQATIDSHFQGSK